MGHDEETNNFNGGENSINPPVAPNPRAQIANNRLGMRPARNLSAMDELNRITEDENRQKAPVSETGDIVLNADVKQPKDKKIIIIIVLAILVVAVFAFGLIMTNGKNGGIFGGNAESANSMEYKIAFNNYSNYLMYGEPKDTALEGANDNLGNYAFNKARRGTNDDMKKFIEEANSLFDKFYESYKKVENDNTIIKSHVSNYRHILKTIYLYETSDKLEEKEIVKEYIEKSGDDARKLIESSYLKLAESDSEYAKDYANVLRESGMIYLAELIKYSNAGCLTKEHGLNVVCVNRMPQDENTLRYSNARLEVRRRYNSAAYELVNGCWTLSDMINNGVKDVTELEAEAKVEESEDE